MTHSKEPFINKKGCTRWVICIDNVAFKFPALTNWRMFNLGRKANIKEWERSWLSDQRISYAKTLLCVRGGLLNIQQRAKMFSRSEWLDRAGDIIIVKDVMFPHVEMKMDSFGYINGKIVAVDYGGHDDESGTY